MDHEQFNVMRIFFLSKILQINGKKRSIFKFTYIEESVTISPIQKTFFFYLFAVVLNPLYSPSCKKKSLESTKLLQIIQNN